MISYVRALGYGALTAAIAAGVVVLVSDNSTLAGAAWTTGMVFGFLLALIWQLQRKIEGLDRQVQSAYGALGEIARRPTHRHDTETGEVLRP